jgi:hypothetical protein
MKQELYKVQVEAETPDCTLECVIDDEITDLLGNRVGKKFRKKLSHKAKLERIKRRNSAKLKRRYDDRIRENLMPLNIEKNYILENKTECDNYDYHQRKVKEIRRLQYAVTVQELSANKKSKTIPVSTKKTHKFSVLDELENSPQ